MKAILGILIFIGTFQTSIQTSTGCFLNGGLTELGNLRTSSGRQEVDNAAQQEIDRLRTTFAVNPQFYFFDEIGSPNAYASAEIKDQGRPDGTVIFGLKLHVSEEPKSIGSTTIPMIMAHEFGHIVAFKHNLKFVGKRNELWADYCAGAYMYFRRGWKSTDVGATLKSFFDIGDYAYNSPSHHGTPAERYAAILKGFNDADSFQKQKGSMTLDDLLSAGQTYIRSIQ